MSEQEFERQIARLTYERDQARNRINALLHALVLETSYSQAMAAEHYKAHSGAADMGDENAQWKLIRTPLAHPDGGKAVGDE